MTSHRPPLKLDASAFAATAAPIPDPVQQATTRHAVPPVVSTITPSSKPQAGRQASRVGKVQVVAWVLEKKRRDLKIKATRLGCTVDEVLCGLIDDFLAK